MITDSNTGTGFYFILNIFPSGRGKEADGAAILHHHNNVSMAAAGSAIGAIWKRGLAWCQQGFSNNIEKVY